MFAWRLLDLVKRARRAAFATGGGFGGTVIVLLLPFKLKPFVAQASIFAELELRANRGHGAIGNPNHAGECGIVAGYAAIRPRMGQQ